MYCIQEEEHRFTVLRELHCLCQRDDQGALALDRHTPLGCMDLSVDVVDEFFGQVGRVAR